ncbi:glycosyltransferase family 4 protein [Fodinicola acaciae]|uniref:glycosyltransferase family 4 protein n=1 Tax=Fodinicola acaciae TaxID=2681555 RepID=UPI0013D5E872|nr:glycosyltransferase family 1 protein [Fodinicola acaciae]
MKVFFDARWTRTDTHDGISRYGASLVEAFSRIHPVTMIINDERQLALLPDGIPYVRLNSAMSPKELFLPRKLRKLGADVVFSPMQVIGSLGRDYQLILTLHDLIYYRHRTPPGFLPLPVRIIWRLYHMTYTPQRLLLNRADAVATVSETSRDLIVEHRLTRRPVEVIYNAPPEGLGSTAAVEPTKDLVYMGSFMPYKNVETLIAGMRFLPGYTLHLVSRIKPEREAELRALVPDGAEVVFWRGISDGDYHQLLKSAAALVTASKDEGFGLPLIEAMAFGAPVVCSGLPVFHEVAGEAAAFFDTDSPRTYADAVLAVSEPARRAELAAAGRARAADFTWDSSARRLLALMQRLTA